MKNSFSNCLDNIKAEEELKENTKSYVKEQLNNIENGRVYADASCDLPKNRSGKRRFLVAASSIAACAVLFLGGYAYCQTPINYVSVDINPSIELGVNRFDRVVSVEAYNEDGTQLLLGNQIIHLPLDEALDVLVLEANEQGYIDENGSTVIAVTAESDDEEEGISLQTQCEEDVNNALRNREVCAIVYGDCSNLEFRTQAREVGISPGKYKLIGILQALDPSIDINQYKGAKVTEIITKINELMISSDESFDLDDLNNEFPGTAIKIRNTAQLVEKACERTQQHINQGLETGEEEQIQVNNQGSKTKIKEENQNQNKGNDSNEQEELVEQEEDEATDTQSESGITENNNSENQNGYGNSSDFEPNDNVYDLGTGSKK